ncbi:Hypothetical Protein FCC1311_099532 [Hondaea fermentalgiana]|uniref:Uncharacterized protein n=1 Tax=Hondaea fermentalgiana TaxID=2315210 RepID=A0A2R5GSA7_9STRA|nr:Hypothetical Protein FCC1311_099532 [Hondaea fermentalgiana]|eukprot:GBG33730.1 Hypothetical Protein FCC1311_099532 [Hondaea fermentalgiana]
MKRETEEMMLEKSAEELAALLDDMQPRGGDEDWKKRTESLVRTIADEINRMVAFSGTEGELTPEKPAVEECKSEGTRSESGSRFSTSSMSTLRLEAKVAAALEEDDSILSYLSSCSEARHGGDTLTQRSETSQATKAKTLTPYEIWKAARWRQTEAPVVKELTPKQVEALSERLYAHQITRDLRRQRAQDEALVEELASLDFRPRINKRSRKLARVKPIQERLQSIIQERETRLAQERQRLEEEEIAGCTGAPRINHTKRWKPRVSRRYIDAALEEARAPSTDLTFAPLMNVRSLQMAERASEEGRRQPIEEASPKRFAKAAAAAPPEPPFHPQINPRSRQIVREGPVHERLFQQSTASQSSRPATDLRLDEPPTCASAEGTRATGGAASPRSPRHMEVNEIPYVPMQHDFILQRLRSMGADVRYP